MSEPDFTDFIHNLKDLKNAGKLFQNSLTYEGSHPMDGNYEACRAEYLAACNLVQTVNFESIEEFLLKTRDDSDSKDDTAAKKLRETEKELEELAQTYNELVDSTKVKANQDRIKKQAHLPVIAAAREIKGIMDQSSGAYFDPKDNDKEKNIWDRMTLALNYYQQETQATDYFNLYNNSQKQLAESQAERDKLYKRIDRLVTEGNKVCTARDVFKRKAERQVDDI